MVMMKYLRRLRESESRHDAEGGFALLEALVSIGLISIFSVAVVGNLLVALRTAKITEANHAASSLASSKMEELASTDPSNLDAADSGTENDVTWGDWGFTFTRTTTVTVNADSSRSATVNVSSNSSVVPTNVTFETTFVLWE